MYIRELNYLDSITQPKSVLGGDLARAQYRSSRDELVVNRLDNRIGRVTVANEINAAGVETATIGTPMESIVTSTEGVVSVTVAFDFNVVATTPG